MICFLLILVIPCEVLILRSAIFGSLKFSLISAVPLVCRLVVFRDVIRLMLVGSAVLNLRVGVISRRSWLQVPRVLLMRDGEITVVVVGVGVHCLKDFIEFWIFPRSLKPAKNLNLT